MGGRGWRGRVEYDEADVQAIVQVMNRSNPPWNVSRLARILSRERPAHTYSSYQTFLQKNMVERLNLQQKWRESRAEHGLQQNQEHVPRNQRVKTHHAVHTTSSHADHTNVSPPRVAGGMSVGELHAAFAPRSSSVESLDELDDPQNPIANEQRASHSSENESEEESMDEEEMLAFENRHIQRHIPRPPPTKRRHESFLQQELDYLVDQLVDLLSELRWGQIHLPDGSLQVDIEAELPNLNGSFWKKIESTSSRHSARSWMLHFERNASTLWSNATDRYVLRVLPSSSVALDIQDKSGSVSPEQQNISHRSESTSFLDASASPSSDTLQEVSETEVQQVSDASSQEMSEIGAQRASDTDPHDQSGNSPTSNPNLSSITLTNAEKTNSDAPQNLRRLRSTARHSRQGTSQLSASNKAQNLSNKQSTNRAQRAHTDSDTFRDARPLHTVHSSESGVVPSTSTPKRVSARRQSTQDTPNSSMDAANVSNALPIQTPESRKSPYTPYSVRVGQRKDHHEAKAHARERQEASLSDIVPSPLPGPKPRSTPRSVSRSVPRSTSRSASRSVPPSNLHSVYDHSWPRRSTDLIDLSGALRPWQSEARRTSQIKIEQQLARAQYEARVWELCSDFALTTPAQLVPFMMQAEGDVDVCRECLEEYIDALACEYDTERTTILELLETQLGNFEQVIQVLDIQQRSFERSMERSTEQRSWSRH
ncbi:hypothetical protein MPSI1_003882 [Malassezia psittaci]|uniref:Uncharacterized protein n=1 Tax=Malassezia psittaci TaxID=1821823 RepID=A0AAF0FEE2_9BASI|nr:hypothetical protein MPSI1_003882 [Malassezia psittaci]